MPIDFKQVLPIDKEYYSLKAKDLKVGEPAFYKQALPLAEDFYSLQGEGFNVGEPAYFIRLAGCKIGCDFCDSKNTWNENAFPRVELSQIVKRVVDSGAKNVVVTGGEPLLYNLDNLCKLLHNKNLNCWLETSGSESLSGSWDWICVSPKVNAEIKNEFYEKADEIKFVISSDKDIVFAEEYSLKFSSRVKCFLQCEWDSNKQMQEKIISYIKEHPKWRLSIQTHKYLQLR